MGAAALALTYTSSGRFDAYVERGVRLWDIAAGGLILQCAGGEFWHEQVSEDHYYRMVGFKRITPPEAQRALVTGCMRSHLPILLGAICVVLGLLACGCGSQKQDLNTGPCV